MRKIWILAVFVASFTFAANAQTDKSSSSGEPVKEVQINKRPLDDLEAMILDEVDQKRLDLTKNFSVTLYAVIKDDGLLDTSKSKFDPAKESGDPEMIKMGKEALAALGQTGFFAYLRNFGDKVIIILSQDDRQLGAQVLAQEATPEKATTLASTMNAFVAVGKANTKDPSDERTLLNGASATTDGKNAFILNIAVPKAAAQDMFRKSLQAARERRQSGRSS